MKKLLIIVLCMVFLCGFSSCARDGAAAPPDTGFEILATPSAGKADIVVTTDFSALVTVNEQGESVFALSVGDFIECYNGVYRQCYGKDYLKDLSSEGWQHWSELSPRFGYAATRFEFSADRSVWPMPTISVYAPEDKSELYEIRMTFDDHGYQDDLYVLFSELCGCLLNMACPALTDAEADEAFRELYALSDENFFGDHHEYGDPERPPLTKLLSFGSVGFYCFYGAGNIELCMIPLTTPAMVTLQAEGVAMQAMRPSEAAGVYNSIGEVEPETLEHWEEAAKAAMLSYRDIYKNADKGDVANIVLSEETLSQIVDAIGAAGCSVIDFAQNLNMKNPERLMQFGQAVNSGQDAEVSYFTVHEDGRLSMNTLTVQNGIGTLIAFSLRFDEALMPSVCEAGQYALLNAEYTEKGWLIFERDISKMTLNKMFNMNPHTLIRVAPYDETCRQLCRKYIEPVGYWENKLFTSSWTESDFGELDFNGLFPILYGMQHGTDTLTMYSANELFELVDGTQLHLIPSAQFEEIIQSYLDISSEQIRALSDFSTESDSYYMCGFFTGYYSVMPRIPEPEVTDYRYNADGTLTLTVDAVFPWYGTDRAFTHEVTVRDTGTGFEYVSNRVYEAEDNIFPEETLFVERIRQLDHLAQAAK